jgi:putative transposase
MPQPSRIKYPGAWYHIFNRSSGKKNIFNHPGFFELFLDILSLTIEKYKIEIHTYCIMPNHYHLLAYTPLGNISIAMQYLLSNFTKKLNYFNNSDGAIFRSRYKSLLIENPSYLLQVSRYIHNNPAQAGLVKLPCQYKWSSYPSYLNKNPSPKWLHKNTILSFFNQNNALDQLQEYVNCGTDQKTIKFYSKKRYPPTLKIKT